MLAALVAMAVSGQVLPQEPTADTLAGETVRYNSDRKRLIAENLRLTPAEAQGFWPIYEQFEKDMVVIRDKRRKVITEFGENYDEMTDARAKEILIDALELEEDRSRLRKTYLAKFEKVLPIKKLARYYQIERKIRAFVDAGIAEEIPLIK